MKAKEMNGEQFAHGLIAEIEKREVRFIKVPPTWDNLKELVRDVLDPKPAQVYHVPFYAPPVIRPDYPKLKICYAKDGTAQEWLIANTIAEEAPYHGGGWWTYSKADVDREIERLKAANVPERPKDESERRRAAAAKK